MLVDHFIAFDDFIQAGVTAYSSAQLNERLARHDTVGLFIVLRRWSGSGTLNVWLEHSDDGIHWTASANAMCTSIIVIVLAMLGLLQVIVKLTARRPGTAPV